MFNINLGAKVAFWPYLCLYSHQTNAMKIKIVGVSLIFALLASIAPLHAQKEKPHKTKAFSIGDGKLFDKLSEEYNTSLMSVVNFDHETAMLAWLEMVKTMDRSAKEMGLDLDGVKLQAKVFWNPEGQIDYIAYELKGNSKNVGLKVVESFLEIFGANFTFLIKGGGKKFSHYAAIHLPFQLN